MATEAKRAPMMVRKHTSMSAASAVLASTYLDKRADLVPGWVLVWQACGGALVEIADVRTMSFPLETGGVTTLLGSVPLSLQDDRERLGAVKALSAILQIAGRDAVDAVFAYADVMEG